MPVATIPHSTIDLTKGGDETIRYRILAPETVQLTADALLGATALTVRPDHAALASGDKLLFGENVVITLSGACAAGAVSVPVNAIPSALPGGTVLQKVRDLTGYTLEFEVLTNRGDPTPLITKTGASVAILTQTGDDRGHVEIAIVAADKAALEPGSYFSAFWRRNSGTARPLAEADVKVSERGFLA